MPIGGLADLERVKAKRGHEVADLGQRQGGVQRVGEHPLLMGVGPRRVQLDQAAQRRFVVGPKQVAHEQDAAGRRHAHHFRQHGLWLGDVMHDAVGDHRPEGAGGEGQPFGVAPLQMNAIRQAGPVHVVAAHGQHLFGQIDGDDDGRGALAAKFDGDLGGPRAHVEDGIATVPGGEEVRHEDAVDRGVVHRVVVAGFLGGIHHFGFEDAR